MKRFIECWNGPTPCTCTRCNQPTPNGMALYRFDTKTRENLGAAIRFTCDACYRLEHDEYTARRKAQLAAEPRCEIDGCTARGNWRSLGILLCGRHLKKAQRAHARAGANLGALAILGALQPVTADDVKRWASA